MKFKMISFPKILIFIICFNLISTLISFDENNSKSKNEPLEIVKSFEELDEIMSNSEFSEIWKNFRKDIQNGETISEPQKEFSNIKQQELNKEKKFYNSNDDDILLGESNSNTNLDFQSCLVPNEETTRILKEKYGIIENNPQDELRFIVGNCHPVVLIPGMLATKLQVRINCDRLYEEEKEIFKKIRFYCGENICTYPINNFNEEHDLFVSGLGNFRLTIIGDVNKYSGCLGYFLTFFNTKDVCAPDDEKGQDKYVCNYSKYIKIGYYGSTNKSKDKAKCGLNAIQNVVMAGNEIFEEIVNDGVFQSYKPLINSFIQSGYKPGFSLGGIPNDYRRFLSNNAFTTNAIRYQIENLYKNTGKSVVIIGHSYGTITALSNLIKEQNSDLLPKIKKIIAVGPPFAGSSELIRKYFNGRDQYKREINLMGNKVNVQLDEFGFGMFINTLPTAFELRPLPILGKLLNDPEYKEFGDAIKERLELEKECGHQLCSDDKIIKSSVKFDKLFKGYYPSLTETDCKFEKI